MINFNSRVTPHIVSRARQFLVLSAKNRSSRFLRSHDEFEVFFSLFSKEHFHFCFILVARWVTCFHCFLPDWRFSLSAFLVFCRDFRFLSFYSTEARCGVFMKTIDLFGRNQLIQAATKCLSLIGNVFWAYIKKKILVDDSCGKKRIGKSEIIAKHKTLQLLKKSLWFAAHFVSSEVKSGHKLTHSLCHFLTEIIAACNIIVWWLKFAQQIFLESTKTVSEPSV